jgi:hypothetical protein
MRELLWARQFLKSGIITNMRLSFAFFGGLNQLSRVLSAHQDFFNPQKKCTDHRTMSITGMNAKIKTETSTIGLAG